jgi:hypothetical protein
MNEMEWLASLSNVEMIFLIAFFIFCIGFAYTHPIASIVAVVLAWDMAYNSTAGAELNIVQTYALWSILFALPLTAFGRQVLMFMGLGMLVYWLKEKLNGNP